MVATRRGGVLRQAACGAAALASWLAASAAFVGSAPASLLAASAAYAGPAPASAWDLALESGAKRCRLSLRGDAAGHGAPVAMPAGCHLAFASLNGVTRWSETGGGHLQLEDAHGEPLLVFDAEGENFRATSPQGEQLLLRPASASSHANLERAVERAAGQVELAQAQDGAGNKSTTGKKPAPAGAGQKPADVAGRYAVLRDKTHDTGCMVTLDDKAHGPKNTLKAHLAPACRDQGIIVFDPVGWEMVHGQLVLRARKGHTTQLDPQDDGSWMNSPKTGKTLSLKRI